jgi:ABC-type transport system involved in multi-copper enzyme maturation permease subunit
MASFFEFVFGIGTLLCLLVAAVSFLGVIFSSNRKQMALASFLFICLGLGCLMIFNVANDSKHEGDPAKPVVTSGDTQPSATPQYDPTDILAKAQQAYKGKEYSQAIALLLQLHK